MAHPWVFESTWETGAIQWDSETDTGSKLSIAHYTDLARVPSLPAPYRGAYCMMVDLTTGDTNDHTLTEGDIDIADAATRYFRWYMYVSPNFTATADDVFSIFELQQAGGTVEQTVGMQITASSNLLEIGVGDGTAPSSYVTMDRGRWVCVELLSTISTGGAGAMTLYLDGASRIALTSLTQAAAVGQGVLGTQLTLATTTGILLFDDFVMDDAQLYPNQQRFPLQRTVTSSEHVFVGPGTVDAAVLYSTTAGNIMRLYDTDTGNVNEQQGFVAEVSLTGAISVSGPLFFERGCFAEMTGTDPRGAVLMTKVNDEPGGAGPKLRSDGAIRRYASLRKPRPQNV